MSGGRLSGRKLPSVPAKASSRGCGECSACCVYPSIPELNKPAGVRCDHLDECGKCSIYALRPPSCRNYRCAWLDGHGKHADNPARSGVLIDFRDTQFGRVLIARSAVSGTDAISSKRGKQAIKRISSSAKTKCYVTADDDNQRVVRTVG